MLSIRVMQSRNSARQRFPSVESLDSWSHDHGDSVELSERAVKMGGDSGTRNGNGNGNGNSVVRVVFIAYNQLDRLISPRKNQDVDDDDESVFVNSKILSASLSSSSSPSSSSLLDLPDPARIVFKHLRTVNVSSPECVRWDYLSDGWSGDGCRVEQTNRTHTVCLCSKLANFALLMRGREEEEEVAGGTGGRSVVSLPKKTSPATTTTTTTKHVSTVVVAVAAVFILGVAGFFAFAFWRSFSADRQCGGGGGGATAGKKEKKIQRQVA